MCEYVPGTTLREALRDGLLPTATLLRAGTEIASALAAAHTRHLVHRDLKPENVMLTPEGSIKILDFGLARFRRPHAGDGVSQTRLTQPGAVIGTPGHMAPEQLRGADPDFRADLFAFGVTLYELATGRHPFGGDDPVSTIARVLESEPAPLGDLGSCPPGLQPIVSRCLRKTPQARYDDTGDLVLALEAVRREQPSADSSAGPDGAVDSVSGSRPASWSPLWWWQLHQIVLGVLLYAMLIPLWMVRGWPPGLAGNALFFGAVATAAFVVLLFSAAAVTMSEAPAMATLLVSVAIRDQRRLARHRAGDHPRNVSRR